MMIAILALALLGAFAVGLLILRITSMARQHRALPGEISNVVADRHHAMVVDLHGGLAAQAARMHDALAHSSERIGRTIAGELDLTRDRMQALQAAQAESLARTREMVLEK